MGQGPATFEEMGIPQGKSEGDCVSFSFLTLLSFFAALVIILADFLFLSPHLLFICSISKWEGVRIYAGLIANVVCV